MTPDNDGGNYLYRLMRGQADPAGLAQETDLQVLDLGSDVKVMLCQRNGAIVGLIESHRAPDGGECGGSVTFDVPEAEGLKGQRWQLVSLDPLHIEPSVLCSCGWHGWIHNGQWVNA